MDLETLSAFALVATHGGVARASRASGRPRASLSRQVMELEASLGVRLFERGSRSLHLTQEGELLVARTTGPLGEIAEVAEALRDGRAEPRGRLRVNVPAVFGHMLMGRLAGEFAKAYPEIRLEVTVEDRAVDPAVEGYDVVVRIDPAPCATLVGHRFARDRLVVVAAPTHAPPWEAGLCDGTPVPAIVRTAVQDVAAWQIAGESVRVVAIRQILQLPSLPMVRDAVLTGVGAAKLPRVLVADDLAAGRLISWGETADPPVELWALHVSRRFASAKVKAFMRALETAFPDEWL